MVLLSPYCLKALLETLPHYLLCSSSSYRARRQVARLLAYFCAPPHAAIDQAAIDQAAIDASGSATRRLLS
jgi:hypothetical protein